MMMKAVPAPHEKYKLKLRASIGPSEIENCLSKHRAVANAAVLSKPDAERGNIVKAFIGLTPGIKRNRGADNKLIADLQTHVRGQLAPYGYPKEIELISAKKLRQAE